MPQLCHDHVGASNTRHSRKTRKLQAEPPYLKLWRGGDEHAAEITLARRQRMGGERDHDPPRRPPEQSLQSKQHRSTNVCQSRRLTTHLSSSRVQVQFRHQIERSSFMCNACKCDVYIGIVWLRNTIFESRITRNIIDKFTSRSEEILQLVEREALLTSK